MGFEPGSLNMETRHRIPTKLQKCRLLLFSETSRFISSQKKVSRKCFGIKFRKFAFATFRETRNFTQNIGDDILFSSLFQKGEPSFFVMSKAIQEAWNFQLGHKM